jgi:transposase
MPMQSKGFSFEGQNIFIGIDVHLKTWSVNIMTESGCIEKYSQAGDAKVLQAHLRSKYPQGIYHSVYESGFCGFSTHYALLSLGIDNIIVNAADVPESQKEKTNKSDPVDAKRLARELKNQSLTGIHIPKKESLFFRELVRLRSTIVKEVSRWKVRIKHLLYRNGVKFPEYFAGVKTHWTARFLRWLEEDVVLLSGSDKEPLFQYLTAYKQLRIQQLDITRKLRDLCKKEPYASDLSFLCSIPGIGFLSAICFLSEIEDINRFQNEKHFASFLGLVPTCHDSGEKESRGVITFRANKHLRKCLIESAWTAIRCDLALSACYRQYCRRMDENKAIVRIARKLSNRILTVLKRKEKYINEKNNQTKKES